MTSRISLAVASIAAALALGACGGGNNASVSARQESTTTTTSASTTTTTTSTVAPSTTPATSSAPTTTATRTLTGFKAVEYSGVRFQVPGDWPVYDLGKDPTRCVRFDQHAVYLGHAGANQDCPAQLVGRTEAVQVEPIDAVSQNTASAATAPSTINGLAVHLDPNSAITGNLVASFDEVGLVATVTFRQSDTLAQKVLGTFERAS
jgi:hypothetical protein